MRKIILLSFVFFYFYTKTFAQKVMHSLGAGANLITQTVLVNGGPYGLDKVKKTESLFHGSGDYFFRYNVTENEKSSISIGVPVSLGLGSANDPNANSAGLYIATDVSAGAFYNAGRKSTHDNDSKFGYFVGGGFSYGYVGLYYDKKTQNISTYGPMIYTGMRFAIKKETVSAGFFFRYGLETEKLKTFGIKMMKDF